MPGVHGKRPAANIDRLPAIVLFLFVFISVDAMFIAGFRAGRQGSLNRSRTALPGIVLAAVITVVTDLVRPVSGLVRVSQQPIADLIHEIDVTLQKQNVN